jgi:dehydrogenase/reductase SDR family protein 7B
MVKNKVVIITGGSSGIGKACAIAFGKAGARIVITGRNEKNLSEALSDLKKEGIEALSVNADVSVEKDNEKVVNETLKKFGQIDVLINNAGISMRAMFEDVDLEVIRKVMDINFYGTVYATKYALPHILKSKGSIVGMSSIAGHRGLPVRCAYSASKFAVQGFMEALRTELLKREVNVLVVCPGFTTSNIRNSALSQNGTVQGESQRDENDMMTSEEVAAHVLQAVIKRKRTITLTMQGKMTIFMNKWLPGLMDKIVYNHLAKEKNSPLK